MEDTPDSLSEDNFMTSVLTWRGAIIYAYASLEFLTTKLILDCSNLKEYDAVIPKKYEYSWPKRLGVLKRISDSSGPCEPLRTGLNFIWKGLNEYVKTRHQMVHSIMVFDYVQDEPYSSTVTFKRYDMGRNEKLTRYDTKMYWQEFGELQLEISKFGDESIRTLVAANGLVNAALSLQSGSATESP